MKNTALILVAIFAAGCGAAETSGPPCSIANNEDGTFTISCSNGTSVVLRDGEDGAAGAAGQDGKDGATCKVAEVDNAKLISCSDGTSVTIRDGEQGPRGASCAVVDNGNGTSTVGCEDGTTAVVRDGELCQVTPNAEGTLVIISCPNDYVVEGSAIIEGDVNVRDSVTLALIRNYSHITGNLSVFGVTNISLPNLSVVGGYVMINNSEVTKTVDLHSLVSIAEHPAYDGGFKGLRITGNTNLEEVDLSALQVVGPSELPPPPNAIEIRVQDNPHLPACWADALIAQVTTIGDAYQSGNDDTATCN
jgi:hypothetical protein